MSMESEMRAKFGGLWNSFLLLFVVIVCMRFSGLEQAGERLSEKILCGIHLFLGCIAAGILLGILRIFLGFSNDTYTRAPASANFTQGLKYGIVGGGVLIFLIGLLHFDNFLGVFQPVAHGLAAKLTGIFS